MAKNRTELLRSIKSRLDSFIKNPALNPDYSSMTVSSDEESDITDYMQDIVDDIDHHFEYAQYDEFSAILEDHDKMEQDMLEIIIRMNDDCDMPDEVLDVVFEDRSV